jgi:uncharacterized membrane protein
VSATNTADVAASARSRLVALPFGLVLVVAASALWASAYGALAIRRYHEYDFARVDLGFMVQAVWNTAHGHFLEGTLPSSGQETRLAGHVDPILAVFAPGTYVLPTAQLLLVFQAIALAAGAIPLFAFARRRLRSDRIAVLVALTYLLYPWVAWQTQLGGFYPTSLAIPLTLLAIWALDAQRYVWFAVAAGLLLMCGELVGLSFVGLGVWHGVSIRRWRIGAAIASVGVAWTAACLWVVIPAVGGGPSPFYGHYDEVGGSPLGLLKTAILDPGAIAHAVLTRSDIVYLVLLAVPLLGVFVAAPLLILGALPQLLLNTLSGWPATTGPREHYGAVILPFLLGGTVIALAKLRTNRRRVAVATAVVATTFLLTIPWGPWPGGMWAARGVEARQAVFDAVELIPSDAAVSSTNRAGVYLSERRYVYAVPVLARAEWVLVDRRDAYMGYLPGPGPVQERRYPVRLAMFERGLESDHAWQVVFDRDDVAVYKRSPKPTEATP